MKRIPYGRQEILQSDIDAVTQVLESDFITQGPLIQTFEQALADYCGANHAVAVNSATSALHIACLALHVGPGDCVWTSPNTFVASANCARLCGADIDFVDIDPATYNLCAKSLEEKLSYARKNGQALPKVVIVVHFAGQSCDMQAIDALAQEYQFRVIEDASHAVGGRYLGEAVGCCRYSDITVFSFHPVKIITTGEGGVATCNDARLHERMQLFRTHGVNKPSSANPAAADEPWLYEQLELGLNYRLTDIQAALGISQLQRLDSYVARRRELAERYDRLLQGAGLVLPEQAAYGRSAFHLYPVQVGTSFHSGDYRRRVYHQMVEQGIGVNVHYIPVHTQPYYQNLGFAWGDYPQAESYYLHALTLPLFGSMTEQEQDRVVAALLRCLALDTAA